jgi:hypothetical protein
MPPKRATALWKHDGSIELVSPGTVVEIRQDDFHGVPRLTIVKRL